MKSATGKKEIEAYTKRAYLPQSRALTDPPPGDHGKLLSGNEAIAQAAWEAGVHVACGYPGTPSTEILEALSRYREIKCEWSTNEKVALEIALGSCFAGARALVSMKHVGLNVAADPFFSSAYTGVNGGLVIVSADDPGMHSSQNEQDNRLIAAAARIPVLEPSSSQEARDFTIAAFEISERYDIPVMLRTTTRISHGKAPVKVGQRSSIPLKPYRKLPAKNILLPSVSRAKHSNIESMQMPGLRRESARYIQIFEGNSQLSFITSGPSFHYVREAFPDASVMKLGMVYPLPYNEIRDFLKGRKRTVVVEELEPFLEHRISALGFSVEGKSLLPRCGELSVDILRSALAPWLTGSTSHADEALQPLPPRPPVMCAGCSHRGTFYALKQLNAIVSGDVGCYTLGALAPLEAVDFSINMGASISMAHGMEKVLDEPERKRLVAVIGDSTFFHSGISGLIDVLYNGANTTTVILDNHTSAMTGHQSHPGSGTSINGEPARHIDIPMLCKSLGIESVRIANPYDLLGTLRIISEEQHREAPSVIIADAPCALKARVQFGEPITINADHCTHCFACTQLGCPAIEFEHNRLQINPLLCIACGHCGQVCADCNAGLDISLILELMHQKRYRDAFEVIISQSPLPAVASRVCPHPCERDINALGHHQQKARAERYPELIPDFPQPNNPDAISISAIERFLGDYGIVNISGHDFAPREEQGYRVAVIGAGPAGLSAAWHLRRQGYGVTVFDANEQPGGMLRYGIPDFRLPRHILDAEIDRFRHIGIQFRPCFKIDDRLSCRILQDEYDAVVVAAGESAPRRLTLEKEDAATSGLWDGLTFLHQYNSGRLTFTDGHVAIIGGGNTAIDCARSAIRLGLSATVYYRREQKDMPAFPDEIASAQKEGVLFEFQVEPKRLLSQNGKVTGLTLFRTALDTVHHMSQISAKELSVAASQVVLAIGEVTDLKFLPNSCVEGEHSRGMDVNFMGLSPEEGLFGCGDAAFGHGTVTQSIATGKRTAESVTAFLQQLAGPKAPKS